jgi:arylsulfatase A-like enzyme
MTGRNHHRVGAGQIAEFANDWDGYTGVIPKSSATIAEVLGHYGYATAAFGKDHNTPVEQIANGPYDRTPTGRGFDYFYGFIAGETSQWEPTLWENTTPISMPHVENYEDFHLTEAMADKAITWMRRHLAMNPDRPFLMWWTPGAVHGPHHVAKEVGRQVQGQVRRRLGRLPGAGLRAAEGHGLDPGRHDRAGAASGGHAAWEDIPDDEKRLPGAPDGGLRRLPGAHGRAGRPADRRTRSPRHPRQHPGHLHRLRQRRLGRGHGRQRRGAERPERHPVHVAEHIAVAGAAGRPRRDRRPKMDNMYHAAWAWAGDSPFRYTKLIAADWGGTRTPMVISWPKRIEPDKTPRPQFTHVNDVVPTIYEILGITPPKVVDGHEQDPIDGVSFAYTFDSADAPERKKTQYFDIMGSRGIYHEGWMASTFGPRTPWVAALPDLASWDPMQDQWQLFDTRSDYSLMNDLAAEHPEKLEELKALFMEEAEENKVLPIGGALYTASIPQEMKRSTNTEWTLFEGITRIPRARRPTCATATSAPRSRPRCRRASTA